MRALHATAGFTAGDETRRRDRDAVCDALDVAVARCACACYAVDVCARTRQQRPSNSGCGAQSIVCVRQRQRDFKYKSENQNIQRKKASHGNTTQKSNENAPCIGVECKSQKRGASLELDRVSAAATVYSPVEMSTPALR